MSQFESVVATFPSVAEAESAIHELEDHGWRREQLSLITRGHESDLPAVNPAHHGDRTEKAAAVGTAAGAAVGLLAGSSLFIIPGLGPVLFAGAMASGITGGVVGGLIGAMGGWGVKDNDVRQYENALKAGKALVVLSGEPSELAEGRAELLATSAEKVVIHAATADSDKVDA